MRPGSGFLLMPGFVQFILGQSDGKLAKMRLLRGANGRFAAVETTTKTSSLQT